MKELNQPKYTPAKQIRKYDDANEEEAELVTYYAKFSVAELLKEIDSEELSEKQKDIAKTYLYDRLGIVPTDELQYYDEWFLHEELISSLKDMVKELNELKAQFLNHRHVVNKTYGEKPIW